MSHANDATSETPGAILVLEQDVEEPLSVELELRPSFCAQTRPSSSKVDFLVAGYYKIIIISHSLHRHHETAKIRSGTPKIYEITSSPKNVPEDGQPSPGPSTSSSSIKTHRMTTVSSSTSRPPTTSQNDRDNSLAPFAVADSDGASLEELFESGHKRSRREEDENTMSEDEGGRTNKRSRGTALCVS
jgi:hypothetical protein